MPCLVDVTDEGELAVWDSLAIVEYLAEQHANVWPSDKAARAWARSATAEMHSGFGTLRGECPMNCGLRLALNGLSAHLKADVARVDALWQQGLERFGGPFLAGDAFSAVDAFYAPVAFRVQTFSLPVSEKSQAYVERLLALPAMQTWYQAALEEPWRESMHEADTLKNGTVTADLRKA